MVIYLIEYVNIYFLWIKQRAKLGQSKLLVIRNCSDFRIGTNQLLSAQCLPFSSLMKGKHCSGMANLVLPSPAACVPMFTCVDNCFSIYKSSNWALWNLKILTDMWTWYWRLQTWPWFQSEMKRKMIWGWTWANCFFFLKGKDTHGEKNTMN